jgi:hypothetical protein
MGSPGHQGEGGQILKSRYFVCVAVALLFGGGGAPAEKILYSPVSQGIVEKRLKKYEKDNDQREAALLLMFRESGCDGKQLSEQHVDGTKFPNVVCVLPGSADQTVIAGAHYDHVKEGDGVVDNWSGASLLPSLYEAIRNEPRKHTYIFIGFAAEEDGLVGSHSYAKHMSKEQAGATDAMVNMDTLGLGPTQIWLSHADKGLANTLIYLGKATQSPVGVTDVDKVGSSDSVEFSERKIPSITIHSMDQKAYDAGILHSKKDTIEAIRMGDYYQTYRLVAAYVAYLDGLSGKRGN